jgi:hypothetical protein
MTPEEQRLYKVLGMTPPKEKNRGCGGRRYRHRVSTEHRPVRLQLHLRF